MSKSKYLNFILILMSVLLTASMAACGDDDDKASEPSFSQIVITPEKDVYHVGDVVTCSITKTSPGNGDLRNASYWWYASWWFSDSEQKADFQDFDDNGKSTSQPITLTEAGQVRLYFFGRLEYPHYDWRKVEIGRTITVTAQ